MKKMRERDLQEKVRVNKVGNTSCLLLFLVDRCITLIRYIKLTWGDVRTLVVTGSTSACTA